MTVDDAPDFRVEPTGVPRLENGDAAAAPPPDHIPDAGPAAVSPTAAPAPSAPLVQWTPEEAAKLAVAVHNIVGVGLAVFVFPNRFADYERWRATSDDLRETSAATARSLDHIAPPGVGVLGMAADALVAGTGLIELAAVKLAAVRDGRDAPKAEPASAPAQAAAAATARPAIPTAEPAREKQPASAAAGGAYRHPPELAAILGDLDAMEAA